MVDLFGVITSSVISWGVSRLLDSMSHCVCGSSQPRDLDNEDFNKHQCFRCGRALDQFTNATTHTVNSNMSVASAHISSIHWPSWRDNFKIYYDLDTLNSKYEDVVVEIVLSQFNGPEFGHNQKKFSPRYERSVFEDTWFSFPRSQFPEGSYVFAADFLTYNLWGDLLHRERILGEK